MKTGSYGNQTARYAVLTAWSTAGSLDTNLAEPHPNSNTQQGKNETANMVVQQHSRKLLKMGILMPETCWGSKNKWHLVGFLFVSYHNDAPSNNHQISLYVGNRRPNVKALRQKRQRLVLRSCTSSCTVPRVSRSLINVACSGLKMFLGRKRMKSRNSTGGAEQQRKKVTVKDSPKHDVGRKVWSAAKLIRSSIE